ncbi:post-GPI attachment to proteins factor 6 [Bacillus rossius redtenbacheri]|uniref:post-GPI attachment to proteins factor 6 n=1 Tax=Bacillus rossius redtenbacheri TaxID=93214 RepID=UPI002FDE17C0
MELLWGVLFIIATLQSTEVGCEGPVTLIRLPGREITEYRSFRDVTILQFTIPHNVRLASWIFNATEHRMSPSLVTRCRTRDVSLYLKHGSYPVINPDGSVFPDHFYTRRVPLYDLDFRSDSSSAGINITCPLPGDWFAVAFLSYTDPNNDQILQQGISPNCVALIQASVDVVIDDHVVDITQGVSSLQELTLSDVGGYAIHRFSVPPRTWLCEVLVTVSSCENNAAESGLDRCPELFLSASSESLPDVITNSSVLQSSCRDFMTSPLCKLQFVPSENTWAYIKISNSSFIKEDDQVVVSYSVTLSFSSSVRSVLGSNSSFDTESNAVNADMPNYMSKWSSESRVPVLRQSFSAFFAFNYLRMVPGEDKTASSINITTDTVTVFAYNVHPISDIGGTVSLDLVLNLTPELKNLTRSSYNISVVACVDYNIRSIPIFPNFCLDHINQTSVAHMQINTSMKAREARIHIPHPESGMWYVSYKPFCYVTLYDSSNNVSYEETECKGLSVVGLSFGVESYPCGATNCGDFGRCYNYNSGGLIYSACVCSYGYIGWGCTDDSKVSSFNDILLAVLLLTLSNLIFIPSIYFAIRRRYFTEALVYACTMFFSTFYHACDSGEDIYSFCLFRLSTLQFCDFYSAILALWVTLVAMADLSPLWRSLAHMAGAIAIALGTEYDRTSLWVFVVPFGVGLIILLKQWVWRCRQQRSCYPEKKYYNKFFLPGVLLFIVGVSCYTFLQTRNNYKFVHSAWHAIMALTIVFLLPSRHHKVANSEDSDDSSTSSASLWKRGRAYVSIRWLKRL